MPDTRPIVSMSPSIFKSTISGKTYVVAGKWVEVPAGTELSDAHNYVNHLKPQLETSTWRVSSYTVRRVAGKLSCSCPGYRFHRKCKHLKAVA